MPQPQKFDYADARRRHAAGETTTALAREYGVTFNAVHRVVSPAARARQVTYARRRRTGTCESCGRPAMRLLPGSSKAKHNPDGRTLCRHCRYIAMRERLRFDEHGLLVAVRCRSLDCAYGERWQPPENFTRGEKFRDVREGGIHSSRRACQTRARKAWRARHRDHENAYQRAYKRRRAAKATA